MCRWVDKIASITTDGVVARGFQFGDWLSPNAPPDTPAATKADPYVIATAYLVHSADIVADAARVLGHHEKAERYAALAARTREAFAEAYVTGSGRVLSDAVTVYALALEWGLLPTPQQHQRAAERLADLVRVNGFRISTGLIGTAVITDALSGVGRVDLAYRLLLQRAWPSWLYQVTMGATTVWERWDSMQPDGSVNPAEMTSFNHYALGSVADWIHRTVAGLSAAEPGYRTIAVRPIPHEALTHAAARQLTPYGEASVAWRREQGRLTVDAVVPPGARAVVRLPRADEVIVRHGSHSWTVPDPCVPSRRAVSTVRDLIDSPALWHAAADLLVKRGLGEDTADIARQSGPFLDVHATTLPMALVYHDFDGSAAQVSRILEGLIRTEDPA
jgi:alpha-L-rhamnosidase